jgi:hypothetical protein
VKKGEDKKKTMKETSMGDELENHEIKRKVEM